MSKKRRASKAKQAPARGRGALRRQIHDAKWIRDKLEAFAQDIASQDVLDHAMIVGVRRRGAELARRVRERVQQIAKTKVPYGALDITLYRDDVALRGPSLRAPKDGTVIEGSLDNRVVFLIDEVIFTGRTVRASLAHLMDYGRPGAVRMYVLIDRDGRELPIQPDKVSERLKVSVTDRVDVRVKEVDGEEGVWVSVGGMR